MIRGNSPQVDGRESKETRMSYAESLLAKNEHVVYRGRQHWLAPLSDSLRPVVLVLLGLVILFLAVFVKASGTFWTVMVFVSLILIVVGSVWTAIIYFTWRAQEYLITNRRVLKVEGLVDKRSGDSSLEKINDAILSQGLLARLLKYGNLDIMTAAEEAIDRYEMLARAVEFKKAMLNAKNDLEDGGRGVTSAGERGGRSASAAGGDVEAALDRLAALRDKGKITQADYDRKKADLLDKM
jgi:membrane protein YdbS with pleckstrin-like domain